jgi:hypothetical protein
MKLRFGGSCPDCGVREVHLPAALPELGDDFDWRVRDYDGFRMFMMEELSARFPERTRWTPADLEVVLVEVFATILDQLSDMLDRVATEAFLESARRPETVRQLLNFIGYDAVAVARKKDQITGAAIRMRWSRPGGPARGKSIPRNAWSQSKTTRCVCASIHW